MRNWIKVPDSGLNFRICHEIRKFSHQSDDAGNVFNRGDCGSTSFIEAVKRRRPPGISAKEFTKRRDKLMGLLRNAPGKKFDQLLVCIAAGRTVYMADDVPYPFRQNSDFRYLCGLIEPNSLLLMHSPSPSEYRSHIFIPENTAERKLWHGAGVDPTSAQDIAGVDSVHYMSHLKDFLQLTAASLHNTSFGLWRDLGTEWLNPSIALPRTGMPASFALLNDFVAELRPMKGGAVLGNPAEHIHECRVVKSAAEVALMRHAANITGEAITVAMRSSRAGMREREVWALLEMESVLIGADGLAYPPVVATGLSATAIDYIKNTETLKSGDMIFVDCGCEVDGYCSDVSRAWPVSAGFTPSQTVLYEMVNDVRHQLLDHVKKLGNDYARYPSLEELHIRMWDLQSAKLKELKWIDRTADEKQARLEASKFCPHHIGHYLGMDVHDCKLVSRSRQLKEGMVFAVEPGIYINEDNDAVPEGFRGIGFRIEDTIWLGPNGPEVLTEACPSSTEAILAHRRGHVC
ncbi:putative Xaa-Pro aminopeptidase 3 [Hypsibius exemplaris]|uniref:Xaa-Pro aminopeptidase 3 n=1 Tax=Hypsibius exemplaris TaxID=2072580 RepID=A0A1W0WSR7_HYPEX|nr:putative Xaa-Pro aminopeptidase 3 [Hypsibius exemplaris]